MYPSVFWLEYDYNFFSFWANFLYFCKRKSKNENTENANTENENTENADYIITEGATLT